MVVVRDLDETSKDYSDRSGFVDTRDAAIIQPS